MAAQTNAERLEALREEIDSYIENLVRQATEGGSAFTREGLAELRAQEKHLMRLVAMDELASGDKRPFRMFGVRPARPE